MSFYGILCEMHYYQIGVEIFLHEEEGIGFVCGNCDRVFSFAQVVQNDLMLFNIVWGSLHLCLSMASYQDDQGILSQSQAGKLPLL